MGSLYTLRNYINNDIYIGSTTTTIQTRLWYHRGAAKSKRYCNANLYKYMNEIGINNFFIVLIKEYPTISKRELREKEGKYIRAYKEKYTKGKIINIRLECRTDRQYRIDNRDKIREKRKEYTKKNKEAINIKRNASIICEIDNCGKTYTRINKARHLGIHHTEDPSVVEKYRRYDVENREILLKKRSEIVTCDMCEKSYTKGHHLCHERSQTHQANLLQKITE